MAHTFTGRQTVLNYVALRTMQVNGTTRNRGDLVPEAKNWPNVHNYLSQGWLAIVGGATANPGQHRIGRAEGPNSMDRIPRPFDHNAVASKMPVDKSN